MSDYQGASPSIPGPIGCAHVGTDGRFQRVDRPLCALLGYPTADLVRLRFHDITHPKDLLRDEAQFERLLEQGSGGYSILKRYYTPESDIVWTELNVELMRNASGAPSHFVSRIRPLSTDTGLLEDLHDRAMHDPLTKVFNRGQMDEHLICAARQSQRTGRGFAVLSVDLDGFKLVNDLHGHHAGDSILNAVAKRIQNALDREDLVGRAGGDEFLVLSRNVGTHSDLETKRARLKSCFAKPFALPAGPVRLTASVGTGLFPEDATTVSRLLAVADTALYKDKARRFTVN